MPERVLVTDTLAVFGSLDVERAVLAPLGLELVPASATDEATLAREAGSAAAILVVYARITEPVIAAAAEAGCRVIARCGIGVDNIDVEAATRHGVQVTNVPDYCLDEVADHTLALLLCAARGVVQAASEVREGAWQVPRGGIRRIQGRRLALVGIGRIGRRVGARARAFGLDRTGTAPAASPCRRRPVPAEPLPLAARVGHNALSFHVPIRRSTEQKGGPMATTSHETTPYGKGMDLSFLQKPHEFDPRRTYSTTGTDWQARVDFDRLRRDRLGRARAMMEKHDLGALVCFVGENVRYITSVYQGN